MSHDVQQSAESGIPGGRRAELVPTDSLLPDRFEDFTEDLLVGAMFIAGPARCVHRVQRWGRRGDKQDGIDFEGDWSDGVSVAWQCKRLDHLTAADVRKFVKDCTFVADEYYIVYSGEASSAARNEVKKHEGWDIVDQRGLTQMLKSLPLHRQRQLLDAFWGERFRRQFVQIPGVDSFLGIAEISERRRTGEDLLNDLGPRVGGVSEMEKLSAALDRSVDWPHIVIVNGIGGSGKTRLMIDCLKAFQSANPRIQVLWLSPGHDLDKDAIGLLPLTPAVIVVDDAHRITADLPILLNYATENAGTQLVFGVRGLEAQVLRNEVIRIGFRQDQIREITVGRLTVSESHELVATLSEGLEPNRSLLATLARQARDTPFMAVLTLNMIKRGHLTGHISLNDNLREQVMARYGDILMEGVDAVPAEPLKRALATLSALGTANADDPKVRDRIVKLAGIPLAQYLHLRQQLGNRGIVIEQNHRVRVMPELFADQVLEQVSSIGGTDTGFVEELWNALGDVSSEDLFTSIGSLQWRLAHRQGPHVMQPVWVSVEATIDLGGYGALYELAGHLGLLPLTQPAKTLELLSRIRHRLDELDSLEPGQRPSNLPGDAAVDSFFGSGEIDRTSVERRLAVPYAVCAANSTEGLNIALEALWELGRSDARPVDSALDHPLRVIIDQLCQLNRLPDLSYPERIITKVGQWLATMDPHDAVTPLTILEPFLAKEGTTSEMQDPRAISLGQYQVKPSWARPHRDAIRALCVKHATDNNLPLTAQIVRILESAVQAPRGYFGAKVPDEQRNAWADDDLQTIAALRTIAESTTKPAVRRTACRAIEIPATYSTSPEVMHAAISLLHQLDQREEDDLSDHLLGGSRLADVDSQRGKDAPTLNECVWKISARSKHSAEGETTFIDRMEAREQRSDQRHRRLAESLWGPKTVIRASVDRLDAELRDALLMSKSTPRHQIIILLQLTARQHTDRVPGIIAAIVELPDGPLDDGLPILLDGLQSLDKNLVDRIVAETCAQREGVRWAIGRAAGSFGWASLGDPYAEVVTAGVEDPSERVRQAFLRALPFVEDPITVSNILITRKATDNTISDILYSPQSSTGMDWYLKLNQDQAAAVLDLLATIQDETWAVEQPITHIATAHPRLVLDRLTGSYPLQHLLRNAGDHCLRAAYSKHPDEVSTWILDGCKGNGASQVASALVQVVGDRLPRGVTAELCVAVGTLDVQQLQNLLKILASLNAWAAHHVELARRITERARKFGADAYVAALDRVTEHLTPHSWSGNNAGSPELQAALTSLEHAMESETHDELRSRIAEAQHELQERIQAPMPDYFDEM